MTRIKTKIFMMIKARKVLFFILLSELLNENCDVETYYNLLGIRTVKDNGMSRLVNICSSSLCLVIQLKEGWRPSCCSSVKTNQRNQDVFLRLMRLKEKFSETKFSFNKAFFSQSDNRPPAQSDPLS